MDENQIPTLDRRGIPLTWPEFVMSLIIFGMVSCGAGYYWNHHHTANFFDRSIEILNGKYRQLCQDFGALETEMGILKGKNLGHGKKGR